MQQCAVLTVCEGKAAPRCAGLGVVAVRLHAPVQQPQARR